MNYLDYPLEINGGCTVEVALDNSANVQLLDESNFRKYKTREPYSYYGGFAKKSPYYLKVPKSGKWHVVVDLGGFSGRVRASVSVLDK